VATRRRAGRDDARGRRVMRNPFRSEDAMFRVLLWTLAVAAVVVVFAQVVRALT
jgi:hypothetical protein